MAAADRNPERRAELGRIAEACGRVPGLPARGFHEAIQAVWFLDFVLHAISGARDYSVGRLDQYLLPYYQRDIEKGAIRREDALELAECMFVKMNEFIGIHDHFTTPVKRSVCRDSVQYAVVGGQTAAGQDATNALSHLILDAVDDLRIKQPDLTVRYHTGTERRFWDRVCDAMRRGVSIGICNDSAVIASLMNLDLPLEDERSYVRYGCCDPHLPGREPRLREYQHSLVKPLELALNNGRDPYPMDLGRLAGGLGENTPEWSLVESFEGPATKAGGSEKLCGLSACREGADKLRCEASGET